MSKRIHLLFAAVLITLSLSACVLRVHDSPDNSPRGHRDRDGRHDQHGYWGHDRDRDGYGRYDYKDSDNHR